MMRIFRWKGYQGLSVWVRCNRMSSIFETGSCCVTQAGLSWLSLLSAKVTGICHHAWLQKYSHHREGYPANTYIFASVIGEVQWPMRTFNIHASLVQRIRDYSYTYRHTYVFFPMVQSYTDICLYLKGFDSTLFI
jgi:hypothetical protein